MGPNEICTLQVQGAIKPCTSSHRFRDIFMTFQASVSGAMFFHRWYEYCTNFDRYTQILQAKQPWIASWVCDEHDVRQNGQNCLNPRREYRNFCQRRVSPTGAAATFEPPWGSPDHLGGGTFASPNARFHHSQVSQVYTSTIKIWSTKFPQSRARRKTIT